MKTTHQSLEKIFHKSHFQWIYELLGEYDKARVYLVGGAVRDFFLGRSTKDYDFVVQGIRAKHLESFLKDRGQVNFVGRRFGVYKFNPKNNKNSSHFESFDIALPRSEQSQYGTGHYRDFIIKTDHRLSIQDDLSRRDFTINAIGYDIREQKIIDPFLGCDDIQKKIIRAVGVPQKRFAEDYSRMLRALRFSCQLGFMLEKETSRTIKKYSSRLEGLITQFEPKKNTDEKIRKVAYEIIAHEFVRAFVVDHNKALTLFDEHNIIKVLMPQLERMKKCPQDPLWHSEGDVWTHTRLALSCTYGKKFIREFGNEEKDPLLLLAVLFHDLGKPYTLQTPKNDKVDRIHFYGHDRVGADKTRAIAERLRFSSVSEYTISSDSLWWLVKNHLLLLNSDVNTMKHTTLEKYFFKDPYLGKLLLRLIFVDSLATIRKDGKTSLGNYRACKKRLSTLTIRTSHTSELKKPLLTGFEVMKECKIQSGKWVGDLLSQLREEQLAGRIVTKKDARIYVKKCNNTHRG